MRQVLMLSVAALTALNGCATPLIRKPAPEPDRAAAEPHREVKPILSEVHESATYVLKSLDNPDAAPVATAHVHRGDRIGFRRESDHSLVAVAGKQTFPVPEGMFCWVMDTTKPSPLHVANEQTIETLDDTKKIIITTACVVGACCLIAFCLWYANKNGGLGTLFD